MAFPCLMMNTASTVLAELAAATRLREGPQGVAAVLWALLQMGGATTHDLAARVGIPIPVLAALRREMEKSGLLVRDQGMRLGPAGVALARELWGLDQVPDQHCPRCHGRGIVLPPAFAALAEPFRAMCDCRPAADTALDQAHATPETSLLRAAVLLAEGALLGAPVVFLGDDDLTSVACAMVAAAAGGAAHYHALVVDVDARYLDLIATIAAAEGFNIHTAHADYRQPLQDMIGIRGGAVVTDPPYTLEGLECVLRRAEELLDPVCGGWLLLSFAPQAAAIWLQCQALLVRHGMALQAVYRYANLYSGNSMHAHSSHLYLARHVPLDQRRQDRPHGSFYTASKRTK